MKPDLKRLLLQNILPSAGIAIAAAFVLFCCVSAAIPLECENTVNVYDSTVRLRVVANSDSAADQELKLEVRNDIHLKKQILMLKVLLIHQELLILQKKRYCAALTLLNLRYSVP